ncbi:MAG TPA: PRC and DUF2382 domain-containing protein [Streptosporangiaceae bacterium]|nr:PRC and DUF2382 domain-containing protein [Streptosporangiaceae bacterium]
MPTTEEFNRLVGSELVDSSGSKIGKITGLYMDDATGQPEWAAVSSGMFGKKSHMVPLAGASMRDDSMAVPFSKELVKEAPGAGEDDDHLTQAEEARLCEHYGLPYGDAASPSGLPGTQQRAMPGAATPGTVTSPETGIPPTAAASPPAGTGAPLAGRDTAGGDDAMTRSEEEMRIGRASREAGRARLHKWVETETVNTTVPVTHEEARIVREPITDENRDRAMSGPEFTESEHEVILHEEQPVVEKRTVPKERVRLEKEVVTEEQPVSGTVRKERIETAGEGHEGGTRDTGIGERGRRPRR